MIFGLASTTTQLEVVEMSYWENNEKTGLREKDATDQDYVTGCKLQRWNKYFPFCKPVFWLSNFSAKLRDI